MILFFFLIVCGDFANLYCEIKVRSLYRQTRNDFNRKYYKADFYFPNIFDLGTWNRYNPWEEKEKYGAFREKVMEFITNNQISNLSIFCEDFQTMKILKKFVKEEMLKMKKGLTQVKVEDYWGHIVPTPKALKLQVK